MDISQKPKSKKSFNPFSFRSTIITAYLVSLFTNALLIFIIYSSPFPYKKIGYCIHFALIIYGLYALRIIMDYSANLLKSYRLINRVYSVCVAINFVYYFYSGINFWANHVKFILSFAITICMAIWIVFHVLFIVILKQFLRNLEQRPMQKKVKKVTIDKALSDLLIGADPNSRKV
jgi:hypothetical protein